MPGLFEVDCIGILDDGAGVGKALAQGLEWHGVKTQLAPTVGSLSEGTRGLVLLHALRVHDEAEAVAIHREAFQAARKLDWSPEACPLVFITVQDTGGDFAAGGQSPQYAWGSGLPALAKTVALEWPHASCKAIDIERANLAPVEIADRILAELTSGGDELEVALRADGTRAVVTTEPLTTSVRTATLALERGAVIVATGAGRGVTGVALKQIVRQIAPRLVILGRTPLSEEPPGLREAVGESDVKQWLRASAGDACSRDELKSWTQAVMATREILSNLAEFESLGAEVRYFAVDVRNPKAVSAALESVRAEWGAIDGLIHGAGVLADRLISKKTLDQFDQVFETKVQGLRTLLDATEADPLKAIILFSSIVSRFGNAGQADYAMANEVMNKVAAYEARRRGERCLVRAIGWGPWQGGMVTPTLRRIFEAKGIPLISPEAGAAILANELALWNGAAEIIVAHSSDGMLPWARLSHRESPAQASAPGSTVGT